jgi:hypothetical protein
MRVTAAFYIQCGFKVLMTNPMHLLVKPGGPRSLPRTMQSLGSRTVRRSTAVKSTLTPFSISCANVRNASSGRDQT